MTDVRTDNPAVDPAAQVENSGPMSLADIAGLDVTGVEELRSMQFPVGLYDWEVTESSLDSRMVKDESELRYVASITIKCIGVDTITEKGVEESDVLGKTYTETFFIDPAEAQKGIGYLKGFIADIGGQNAGNMGGVEDAPPGYLDALVSHRFKAKIVKKPGRDGEKYSRLQLVKKPRTA